MKNTSASIRARLLNLAKQQGLNFQLVIIRYLQERLLYRLSISPYNKNFYLKGGALMYAFEGSKTRFTLDIDLLGSAVANNTQTIKTIFTEIAKTNFPNDGVIFNSKTIYTKGISEQDKYNGIRIFIDATFNTIKQRLQVDVGFGDVIVPISYGSVNYPVLLSDLAMPILQAYSMETQIAEKFQAMIELSLANSRMKDFYDVYKLLSRKKYDENTLDEAIRSTFSNRNTPYTGNHSLFTEEFFSNSNRKRMWKAFLNKIGQDKELEFSLVGETIREILEPHWEKLKQ
ncbi:MAG: nucleotidyl transferase AbiEii/AbiGii toxin family protein [Bacteroidales bacterium]